MKLKTRSARSAVAIVLVLALSMLAAACGESDKDVTLTIGTGDTAEEAILGQIYAQALRRAGYTVKKNVKLGSEAASAQNALERDRVSGYPDHLDTALTNLLGHELEQVPTDPQEAYEEAKGGLEEKGLTALPPTPFSLTNAVGVLRKTAEQRDLKTVSDLSGQSEDLTIAGVSGCHQQINCVEGLERLYGFAFAGFIYKLSTETEPFQALETRFSDLAMLPTTDGRLATEKRKFVVLEEDKHLFPAGNATFVTKPEVVEDAGPGFEKAIVAAQKGLTLAVMQELDAKVEIEKQDPAAVAAEYLRRIWSEEKSRPG